MNINSIFRKSLFVFTIIALYVSSGFSGGLDDISGSKTGLLKTGILKTGMLKTSMLKTRNISGSVYNYSGIQKTKPYFKEAEKLLAKRNAIFYLDLDIQLGAAFSSTFFDPIKTDSATQQLSRTETKVGPAFGALLSLNFLGFGFTTGLQYSSKGFETTTTGEKTNLNYLNIPLLLYFDFNVGERIRVDGNLGPYFGLLLSETNDPRYKVKNFDLGLTGNLQLAYMFNKYMGVILGGKYEYGGLNNLGNNENYKKITTSTINVYTGIKFEI